MHVHDIVLCGLFMVLCDTQYFKVVPAVISVYTAVVHEMLFEALSAGPCLVR